MNNLKKDKIDCNTGECPAAPEPPIVPINMFRYNHGKAPITIPKTIADVFLIDEKKPDFKKYKNAAILTDIINAGAALFI